MAVTTRRSTARKEPLTLSLVDVEPDMLDLAGGKAVNLGILLRAGFRVPPGTCVTTAAYTRVVGDLLQPVVEELAAVAPDSPVLDQLAAEARERVLTAPVPPRHRRRRPDERLRPGGGPLLGHGRGPAVRQLRRPAGHLPQRRRRRRRPGRGPPLLGVAVDRPGGGLPRRERDRPRVGPAGRGGRGHGRGGGGRGDVHRQPGHRAPRRGRHRRQPRPRGGGGLRRGEPRPLRVDVAGSRVLHRRLGDKRLSVRAAPGGGVEQVRGTRRGACLSDLQARELAALGAEVEAVYGAPQDTSGRSTGGAGSGSPRRARSPRCSRSRRAAAGPRVFFSVNVAQGVYRPLTPAGIAAIRAASTSVARLWGIDGARPAGRGAGGHGGGGTGCSST